MSGGNVSGYIDARRHIFGAESCGAELCGAESWHYQITVQPTIASVQISLPDIFSQGPKPATYRKQRIIPNMDSDTDTNTDGRIKAVRSYAYYIIIQYTVLQTAVHCIVFSDIHFFC
jgi:hypothetical protein